MATVIRTVCFMITGVLLAYMGYDITSWQAWCIFACMMIACLCEFWNGMNKSK